MIIKDLPLPIRILAIVLILAATFLIISLRNPESSSRLEKYVLTLKETQKAYVIAAAQKDSAALEQILQAFSEANPILTDWLRQDQQGSWQEAFDPNKQEESGYTRVAKVLTDITRAGGRTQALQKELDALQKKGRPTDQLYLKACEYRRELRLKKFLSLNSPVVFAQHHNFKMSFIGYTEGLSDARHERFFKPGAKLVKLNFEESYGKTQTLINDPNGMIRDVDVSYDGKRILFAWKKSDRLDDYHIYEYNLENKRIYQLTKGIGRADYEPVYLPDGDIIFTSTRPEQSVPCWWTEISNLYRMNGEGKYLRRLAIDQVHTLYPQVLEDGRIIYTRWDYSDRGQNYPHPLFNMNPDGTDQRVFYGGNSWFPTSLLHARTIPNSHKVMAIAAGHHTRQHGKVVVLDISEGRDEGKGMHFVAPKREVPYERVDVAQQQGDQFRYPYPISEDEFIASYLPEEPGEKYPRYADDAVYGLYWMNTDGDRELLFYDPEISVGRPVPLHKFTNPKVVPDTVDYTQNTGLYYVHDVYEGVGLKGIPRGTAKKIRVVRLNYRAAGVGQSRNEGEGGRSLNSSPVSIGNGCWDIKEILGDVDIHADGSALFEVPAMESIYLQVLDNKGRVIQTTRSWDTVRPGEKKACVGCHSKKDANFYPFEEENTLAWKQAPQKLQSFYGETRGFSFIKEVQPILDQKCISCHDGTQKGAMSLLGTMKSHGTLEKRTWSESYLNLTHAERKQRKQDEFFAGIPEDKVVNWISKMSKPTELEPYSFGAATSGMMQMLEEGHYNVSLTQEEYHKLAAWLDLLVPFIGEYREGNDWTDQELAYYNYYEYKRKTHQAEEVAHIRDWMKVNGKTADQKFVTAEEKAPNIGTGYGALTGAWQEQNGQWSIRFSQSVLFDKVVMYFNTYGSDSTITARIRLSDGTEVKKPFSPSVHGVTLMMDKPLQTESFSIRFDHEMEVNEAMVFGVRMSELPHYEEHHPWLQLE